MTNALLVKGFSPDLCVINFVRLLKIFVIVQADKAIAELRPILSSSKQLRPFGLSAGEIKVLQAQQHHLDYQ